jgi:hypothetical protein
MEPKAQTADVKGKASGHTEIFTFVLLYGAARHALDAAKTAGGNSAHFFLLSLVASAFCLEAYLNELGERRLSLWSPPERYSPGRKLKLVCKKIGLQPRLDRRPFSSFRWVMRFRNSVAHGRTEIVTFADVPLREEIETPDIPSSTIERACDIATASFVVQDVEAMINIIAEKAGRHLSPLLIYSLAAWVSTPSE